MASYVLVTTILLTLIGSTDCLHCFHCSNLTENQDCNTVTQCKSNERCYGETTVNGNEKRLTLGCVDSQRCPNHHDFSIVGRSISNPCMECCTGDGCNRELCEIQQISTVHNPSTCTDDPVTNCSQLALLINICSDVPHAKNVCRKYCGLCPLVDGDWALWSRWSACTTTCGIGNVVRKRTCTNPAPQHGGEQCVGNGTQVHSCFSRDCPVHGEWSGWGSWENCSVPCGVGVIKRHRTCTDPAPSLFGHDCIGDAIDFDICHGNACNTTANNGSSTHAVQCEDKLNDCDSANISSGLCSNIRYARQMCPEFCGLCSIVDGKWAGWSAWETCSTTCGNGTWTRRRTCTDPAPANGGNNCSGNDIDVGVCNLRYCPVHGDWSMWAHWTTCSSSCGQGITRRMRSCTNPRPSLNGNLCFGDSTEYGMCLVKPCPVNGQWTDWSLWSECSVSCGSGQMTRQRSCGNPKPANGGSGCSGPSLDHKSCQPMVCPVNGGWGSWSSWTSCTKTCDGGEKTRHRYCNNPSPVGFGRTCTGSSEKTSVCNGKPCSDKMIGFTAYYRNGYTNGRVTFSNVIENYGGGFNKNTGTFTCPMSGLYIVSMTIQVEVDDSLNCWIYRNGHNTGIEVDIQGKGQEPATQTAFLRLYRGDALYITGCSSSNVGGETVFSAGLVQYG